MSDGKSLYGATHTKYLNKKLCLKIKSFNTPLRQMISLKIESINDDLKWGGGRTAKSNWGLET